MLGFVAEAEKAKTNKMWSFPSRCSDRPRWAPTGEKMKDIPFCSVESTHLALPPPASATSLNTWRNFPDPGEPGLDPESRGSGKSEAWSIPTSETQRERKPKVQVSYCQILGLQGLRTPQGGDRTKIIPQAQLLQSPWQRNIC